MSEEKPEEKPSKLASIDEKLDLIINNQGEIDKHLAFLKRNQERLNENLQKIYDELR